MENRSFFVACSTSIYSAETLFCIRFDRKRNIRAVSSANDVASGTTTTSRHKIVDVDGIIYSVFVMLKDQGEEGCKTEKKIEDVGKKK